MELIGRETELATLRTAMLGSLGSRRTGAVLVEGVAGGGKSALLDAYLQELSRTRPDIRVGRGAASADAELPYQPFVEALAELTIARADQRDSFRDVARELAPDWLAVIPLVGGMLSAGLVTAVRLRGRRQSLLDTPSDSLFSQYLRLLRRVADSGPLVLCIDDLHAADEASCALLAHLCRGAADTPLVVLGAARPVVHGDDLPLARVAPELERERRLQRVTLTELDAAAAGALLSQLLGGSLDDVLEDWVLQRAGGNPGALHELAARVRTGDFAERVDDTWLLRGDAAATMLPDVVRRSSEQRLRELEPELARLLEHACMQGLEFDAGVLAGSLQEDELHVLDWLAVLEGAHGIVRPLADGVRFRITDAGMREGVLAQIRPLRHRLIEERVAALLSAESAPDRARSGATPRTVQPDDTGARRETAARFVGREQELAQLAGAIAQAVASGRGRALFVQGAAGAGKSALVAELLERAAHEHPTLAIARGRCLQAFDRADPYLPFTDALRDLADEATAGHMSGATLSAMLAEVAPYWLNAVPVVGGILSASYTTATQLRSADDAPSRDVLLTQYLDMIRSVSTRRPLLLLLDDLHWADHASAELLTRLLEVIEEMHVVVLCALRPVDDAGADQPAAAAIARLRDEPDTQWLELGELEGDALALLLASELGGDVSAPLLRWIREAAGGNPLFAGELCRLLRETGGAVEVNGEWELTERVQQMGVPRTAEAVIEARIRRLTPDSIRLLQYASVEGNQFSSIVLARLLELHEQEVLQRLQRLESEQRLVSRGGTVQLPDGSHTTTVHFHHALIQTVLYAQVTGKRRTLLHRRAGEVLEQLYRGVPEPIAARLARHYDAGGVSEPACRYACMAAAAARAVHAQWDAEELLRIARAHATDAAVLAGIEEALGDIYDLVAYYPRGIESYGRARERLESVHDQIRLERKVLHLEWKSAQPPAVLARRIRAAIVRAGANPPEHCRLLLELGRLRSEPDAAQAVARAVDVAEGVGDAALLAQALEQYAVSLIFSGRPADALPHLERALQCGGENDPLRAGFNRNITGVALAKIGRYRGALDAFKQMLDIVELISYQNGIATACTNIGHMLLRLGDLDRAEEPLQRAVRIHERRDRVGLVQSLFNLAERARRAGDFELARERYEKLEATAAGLELTGPHAIACAGLGLCALAVGRVAIAEEHAAEAARIVADMADWFEDRELIDLLEARLSVTRGEPMPAVERLSGVAARLRDSDRFVWGMIELERARVLATVDVTAAAAVVDDVVTHADVAESALAAEAERMRAAIAGVAAARGLHTYRSRS